jgi:aspartyl-tRNA(Asn)/glutamyl-tRNA(Gln) amidotransferase subunit A
MMADRGQAASMKAALEIPAVDYLKAMRIRSLVRDAFQDMLYREVDMLLTPSRMEVAPHLATGFGDEEGRPLTDKRGLADLIPAANLAGLPAISLPCGFAGNLPVGISLVGRAFFENHLLGVGRAFQSQTDWHKRRPPVAAS